MSDRVMINQFMHALVSRVGGVENAARFVDARLGIPLDSSGFSTRKGTFSKRLAGHLDWPLVEIMALEDAVGDPVVRRWLARSLPETTEAIDLMLCVSETAREVGEAVGAVADLASGRGNRARARKEVHEARGAIDRLAAAVDGEEA